MLGYTYEFVSPVNFDLPQATVENGTLGLPSYKVLVLRSTDILTLNGTVKLVQYAKQGLPIIISGDIPSKIASANGLEQAQANVQSILNLTNVHHVAEGSLATTLASIDILPRTQVSTTGNWLTVWRKDADVDYVYVFSNTNTSSTNTGSIKFATTKQPFKYDAWTGAQTPIVQYTQSAGYTELSLTLTGNQTAIFAFKDSTASCEPTHVTCISPESSVMDLQYDNDNKGIIALFSSESTTSTITLSDNKAIKAIVSGSISSPITLSNWTLNAESWTPGANLYDSSTVGTKTNYTIQLPTLVPWSEIPELYNISGLGYYSTTFDWTSSCGEGAIINFGRIPNTIRVRINGKAIPALDLTAATADISTYLVEGENTVEAVIATTLYNAVVSRALELESGGASGAVLLAYGRLTYVEGLVDEVVVTPYRAVKIL